MDRGWTCMGYAISRVWDIFSPDGFPGADFGVAVAKCSPEWRIVSQFCSFTVVNIVLQPWFHLKV